MSKQRFLECHDAWQKPPIDTVRAMPPDTIQTYHNAAEGGDPSVLMAVATGKAAAQLRDFVADLISKQKAGD